MLGPKTNSEPAPATSEASTVNLAAATTKKKGRKRGREKGYREVKEGNEEDE